MEYRVLGKTGLKVSAVGLGGIPIQRVDKEAAVVLLDYLEEQGVNFIDTARGYGPSEEYLGYALQGRRDKFILADKAMSRDAAGMRQDIETGLKNLDTDHIDLYQIHNLPLADFDKVFGAGGAMEALLKAKEEGLIHHIGATFHSPDALLAGLEQPDIETVMFPFNLVENQGMNAFDIACQRNIGIIAMKPMAGGNIDDGRLALRYILNDEHNVVAIPGMADAEEARINVGAAQELTPLNDEEWRRIEEWRSKLSGDFCRRCGYCAPCPAGIEIPSCLIMLNYADRYDLAQWAQGRYDNFPAHAGDCLKCGECESRCPYQLPIRQKLMQVKKMFGK